jgi:hypothetical protein
MTTQRSILNRSDYENYLIRVYFGLGQDFLDGAIKRAYLDFNRTMIGMGQQPDRVVIYEKQAEILKGKLDILRGQVRVSQQQFDQWHQDTCQALIDGYQKYGFQFTIGQAQKWINMSLKYIYTLGEGRVPGFIELYPLCHAPLDRILLKALESYGLPKINEPWSRISNYDNYLGIQFWIRKCFDLPPLDVEFLLWQGKSIPIKSKSEKEAQ